MKKDAYVTLKVKPITAAEFRTYSKKLQVQQSETLQLMLDFFKHNGLSPQEDLGPNMITLEKRIKGRINALIAILKDIEKTQTKPTHSMLQLLFQENPVKKKELLKEKRLPDLPQSRKLHPEVSAPPPAQNELRNKLKEKTDDLKSLLDKVVVVRNSFGVPHLRLNMSREEYELLRSKP